MPTRRRPLPVSETGARSTKNTPWSKLGEVAVAELDRRPRLADTTGARQRDDAAEPKLLGDLLQQPLAADERRRVARQVRAAADDRPRLGWTRRTRPMSTDRSLRRPAVDVQCRILDDDLVLERR